MFRKFSVVLSCLPRRHPVCRVPIATPLLSQVKFENIHCTDWNIYVYNLYFYIFSTLYNTCIVLPYWRNKVDIANSCDSKHFANSCRITFEITQSISVTAA